MKSAGLPNVCAYHCSYETNWFLCVCVCVPGASELITRLEQVMADNEASLVAARAER